MAKSPFLYLLFSALLITSVNVKGNDLSKLGIHVVPCPQEVTLTGNDFIFTSEVNIILDADASEKDAFAAGELIKDLQSEWGIKGHFAPRAKGKSIVLTHKNIKGNIKDNGYRIISAKTTVTVQAVTEAGLFYGTQTLLQLIRKQKNSFNIVGVEINDWPDIAQRAVHYDTKHHQDKASYVKKFVKDMARYKINMLVWEWEDKLAYESHPEIGAPGAFTIKEMQDFTRYAAQYHIRLVPLVQGLGHVSFILKWPQYKDLRELANSNWEFCPLKEDSYRLLFDLWDEAIEATPGAGFIHIGSDETYELAACDACKAKAEEVGKSGVYHLFINKATEYLQTKGVKVMAWERPMGWTQGRSPARGIVPTPGLVLTESYSYESDDFQYAKEAKKLGHEVYIYDPNPGIEHIFLPYFYRIRNDEKIIGSLENSYHYLSKTVNSGIFDGMINTSWDDSGLHNQFWMLSFATSAEYSWSGSGPTLPEFTESFFKNYYGVQASNMEELFKLFNDAAYFYMSTFERNVWHHGYIGKTHLPDLPRGNGIEYDPFWNIEYKDMIEKSVDMLEKTARAREIIKINSNANLKNTYDFELFQTMVDLIEHTAKTYGDFAVVENAIKKAHQNAYISYDTAINSLLVAQKILEDQLARREEVYNNIVSTWEVTRLPKGYSTPEKKYFHQQDRARHFANRVPDMSYLIYDEQLLDVEGYLEKLKLYIQYYKSLEH